jgi:hypothetical protein
MSVFSALSIGRTANEKLNRGFKGYVHSIFKHTFNIFDGEEFINIASCDSYKNPINVITSIPASTEITSLNIKKGEIVALEEDRLIIGSIIIVLRNAKIWIPKRKVDRPIGIKLIRKNLETARAYSNEKIQGWLSPLLYYLDEVSTGNLSRITHLMDTTQMILFNLNGIIEAIKSKKLNNVPKYLESIIGLGQGLTPSLDDLLVGFISALKWLTSSFSNNVKLIEDLSDQIIRLTPKTTLLSRQMLKLASLGEVDERVEGFYDSILTKDRLEVKKSIDKLLTIGKTSGSEILIGALLGFYCGLNLNLV